MVDSMVGQKNWRMYVELSVLSISTPDIFVCREGLLQLLGPVIAVNINETFVDRF